MAITPHHFFDYPGIRPSLNQVRETVFNWLQTILPQARCLDLFAGSGAFGIEALSRGAAYVDFIDYHPRVVSSIQQSLKRLDAQSLSPSATRPYSARFAAH